MYKQYFGLNENPFNVNPDPRYLFLTPQTQEALDGLTCGIHDRKGLMLLTGEVGTGKTTLINCLLDWLHQQRTPTAFIFNSHLETKDLYDFILADFEVPFDSRSSGNALMRLNQWLIERYGEGDIPVLVVDEAQGLRVRALEEIRMLLNLETPHGKLLQIVLVGQPELEERLKRYDLRQLKQRITLRCKTSALTLEETHDYIQARLHIAGANGKPVFAAQAMDAVHFYSRGIPRVANLLCEHALINAYVDNVQPVPVQIIEQIAREFQLDDIEPLAPCIDSEGVLGVSMIAPQPTPVNALAPPAAEAELLLHETPGVMAACVSSPYLLAEIVLCRAEEIAPPVLDCETTTGPTESKVLEVPVPVLTAAEPRWIEECKPSGPIAFDSGGAIEQSAVLAMEQVPITSSPLLHALKAKAKFDLSPVSSRSKVVGSQKSAQRPTTVNVTKSNPDNSKLMRLLDLCLSFTHRSAGWRKRFLSVFHSPPWRRVIAALPPRQERSLQSVGASGQWSPAQRGGSQSVVGSVRRSRTIAYLYERLRQPVDPIQLLLLPYSWLFKARSKPRHKSG